MGNLRAAGGVEKLRMTTDQGTAQDSSVGGIFGHKKDGCWSAARWPGRSVVQHALIGPSIFRSACKRCKQCKPFAEKQPTDHGYMDNVIVRLFCTLVAACGFG